MRAPASSAIPVSPTNSVPSCWIKKNDIMLGGGLNRCDTSKDLPSQLHYYYGLVKRQILRYQNPMTHLYPDKSSNKTEGHLRDSIYCSVGVWALYQAYKHLDDDRGRRYELGQSAVAGMRGVLLAWMRQSEQLEEWKNHQNTKLALHSVVDLNSGANLLDSSKYNHLQLDIVCLYLLFLVQMITSGLEIIFSYEEVALVQNLVYYIERAYRTPGYGTWGRGTKYNDGTPEVCASAIGLAKAALEAVNGFNLFGERGSISSVIYVDIDAHNRNRSIFMTLLPRESNTKVTDASLINTISFPAFATQNEELYKTTKEAVVKHLKGDYGFKRFSGDGFGTEIEDMQRRFYRKGETLEFENVENEWPLFYINMIIDGVFKDQPDQVEEYKALLEPRLLYDFKFGDPLVPQMYQVGSGEVKSEKQQPHSQKRKITNAQNPEEVFLWGQAMFIISELLTNNLLQVFQIDPIKRYLPCHARPKPVGRYSSFLGGSPSSDLVLQVVMIAESTRLQYMLANYGVQTQTPTEVEPVQIWPPGEMVKVLTNMGRSNKLGINGRPTRPIGALGTCKIYKLAGKTILCYPLIFSNSEFYLSHDMILLTEDIKAELRFISRYWRLKGRPTFCIMITEKMMRDPHFDKMVKFLAQIKSGQVDGIKVRIGRVQNLLASSCIEHLDFLSMNHETFNHVTPVQEIKHSHAGYSSLTDIPKLLEVHEELADFASQYSNTPTDDILELLMGLDHVYGTIQLLGILLKREGPDFKLRSHKYCSIKEVLEYMHKEAGQRRYWAALRYSSSLLTQLMDSISPYVTQIIVKGKTVTVGTPGLDFKEFDTPCSPQDIHHAIYSKVQPYSIIGAVLQQELIYYSGKLIANQPFLFDGILVLRMSMLAKAIEMYHTFTHPETAFHVENVAPNKILNLLKAMLFMTELSHKQEHEKSKLTRRQINSINGCLMRVPENFYPSVYNILKRCPGGLTFKKKHLPQKSTLKMMEAHELSFFHTVESYLAQYINHDIRFLMTRVLVILATVLNRNPELTYRKEFVADTVIVESLNLYLKEQNLASIPDTFLDEEINFLGMLDLDTSAQDSYIARAIINKLLGAEISEKDMECKLQ